MEEIQERPEEGPTLSGRLNRLEAELAAMKEQTAGVRR